MSLDPRTLERLAKLAALAERGVGGEKENAARMLAKLLAKHGITLDDLQNPDSQRTELALAYSSKDERGLIVQLAAMLLDTHKPTLYSRKGARYLLIELTPAQAAEMRLLYAVHRRALNAAITKAAKTARQAYMHVNRLFPATADDASHGSDLSREELAALARAMQGMQPTAVHKALEQARSAP